jgi:hypothetical protein
MDHAQRVRDELRVRCVWLRTKKAYFPLPQAGDVESPAPTACWWCLKTLEPLGPDGSTSDPAACATDARRCYEGPVVL